MISSKFQFQNKFRTIVSETLYWKAEVTQEKNLDTIVHIIKPGEFKGGYVGLAPPK